ncbi:carboxypeptidase-like regulatory domain-containing protein [Lutispora thermophila]|uniref:Carboxypeptidase regulatory-like domain-containing protein n=1 Tax=Lutispora thermophila DSM 19022 TaxID=1122184 RepID=A0A1M6HCU8_9FIRM|nr:carboxypeptidase-like regulatory domain-containing protein [Lutispora thermophila]SHJ20000.1 Carboxypeptidase regulatory-like domain-containing protein [Lutispora thermophila DSM 19022]
MKDIYEPLLLEDNADNNIEKRIVSTGTNNKLQHQQSLQSNKQDLDQAVELDVKPSQLNLQRIDVTINNKIENYSGKIIGSVLRETDGQQVANAIILLYFGSGTEFPVYRTTSDENGNFFINDLPPGFYTIVATFNNMQCISRNLKVLPGETCEQSLSLVQRVNYTYNQSNW